HTRFSRDWSSDVCSSDLTQNWYKAHPDFFTANNYLCRGIGGQTTMQMLVRFRRDVIDLKPKVVVIMAGTNDIARNLGYISPENRSEERRVGKEYRARVSP